MILAALGVLGVGAAALNLPALKAWLWADWAHWGFAVVVILLVASISALYSVESEEDARRVVKVSMRRAKTSFHPVLRMSGSKGEYQERDVYTYEIELSFRNDTERVFRAFFPQVELLRRRGRTWEILEVRELDSYLVATMRPKGLPDARTKWYAEHRYEIPPTDETIGSHHRMVTSQDGAPAFLNQDIKVRITIDFIGQPKEVIDISLPQVTDA